MIQQKIDIKNTYFGLYLQRKRRIFRVYNNLKNKSIFVERFTNLITERFPQADSLVKEKQDKRTARENFALLKELNIDEANKCKNSIDKNKATSTIRKCRNPVSKEMPSWEKALQLCKILGCDIEYLFGLSDIKNRNDFSASLYLGLSPDTIQKLKEYQDNIKELLDIMVSGEGDVLKYILVNILQYVRYFNLPHMTLQTVFDEESRELSYEEKQNYIKSITMDEFNLALREINKRYEPIRESDSNRKINILELELKLAALQKNS